MDSYDRGEEEKYKKDEIEDKHYDERVEQFDQEQEPPRLTFEEIWDIPVSGTIVSTPAIEDDVAYFGACDKYFYAIFLKNGKMLWKFETGGPILSSPAISDGMIFFGSNDKHVYALNMDGKLVWKYPTGNMVISSPCIVADTVFVCSGDGHLYAFDKKTGSVKWKFEADEETAATPVVVNDMVLFTSRDSCLYAVSADDGSLIWKYRTYEGMSNDPLIVDEKGDAIWDFRKRVFQKMPHIKDGTIYLPASDKNVYALSLDGRLKWKFLANGGFEACSAATYKNLIVAPCFDNCLYALTLDGEFLWKFRTGGPLAGTPLITDDAIYFGSFDNFLYALTHDGDKIWEFKTGGIIGASPILIGDVLYFGSADTFFYAFDVKKREVLWSFQTGVGFKETFEKVVNKVVEYDKRVIKIWKPETIKRTAMFQRSGYNKSDIPTGFTFGGETAYASSNEYSPAVSSSYTEKKKRDKLKSDPHFDQKL